MPDKPSVDIYDVRKEIKKQTEARFKHHQNLIYAVLVIVGIACVTIVLSAYNIFTSHLDFTSQQYQRIIQQLDHEEMKKSIPNKKSNKAIKNNL